MTIFQGRRRGREGEGGKERGKEGRRSGGGKKRRQEVGKIKFTVF